MIALRLLAGVSMIVAGASAGWAADLTRIDRTLGNESDYGASPRYGLLVFGPEARTRVWVVHDGDALYIDRNGNGDLTEPGERIAATKQSRGTPDEGVFDFEAGDIPDGNLLHKGLRVRLMPLDHLAVHDDVKALLAKRPKARGIYLEIATEVAGKTGAGVGGRVEQVAGPRDLAGVLQFAERAADAPIVHFGGPLTISFYDHPKLVIDRQKQLDLAVGTPGLGSGTTALVAYEKLIPKDAHPQVEVVFPAQQAGLTPVKELYELKGRC